MADKPLKEVSGVRSFSQCRLHCSIIDPCNFFTYDFVTKECQLFGTDNITCSEIVSKPNRSPSECSATEQTTPGPSGSEQSTRKITEPKESVSSDEWLPIKKPQRDDSSSVETTTEASSEEDIEGFTEIPGSALPTFSVNKTESRSLKSMKDSSTLFGKKTTAKTEDANQTAVTFLTANDTAIMQTTTAVPQLGKLVTKSSDDHTYSIQGSGERLTDQQCLDVKQ